MKIVQKEIEFGGRNLRLEVGRLAPQAGASVIAQYGETMVLATVVGAAPKEDLGYFPLSVEFIERLYAGGKIKGSRWVKREGRPSDEAVLIGRLIDRSIRPLFPKDFYNEVQVTITVLSVDMENEPDVLSAVATSAALSICNLPWDGPIGTSRIGLKEGNFVINPIVPEGEAAELDLVISSTKRRVVMIEGGAREIPEDQIESAIKFAKEENLKLIALIEDLQKEVGQTKITVDPLEIEEDLKKQTLNFVKKEIDTLFDQTKKELPGGGSVDDLKKAFVDGFETGKAKAASSFDYFWKKYFREKVLAGKRIDGRGPTEVRPIEIEVGVLPRTHGSAIFKRGLTQVLNVTTLGAPSLEQLIESATGEESKRYIHHYSMPPYSVGSVGRMGGLSRREIGHGALAERALEPVIPGKDIFPYTIRVVSEVMSSNGSTSMASTCGSTLSLMDAGVPISSPVAGVAMGLVTGDKAGEDGEFVVLTDLAGIEDFNGDMDFKITGTEKGITAIQLDVKIPGLTEEIIHQTLSQAKEGRGFISKKILEAIDKPRPKISPFAPRVAIVHIEQEKIGEIIGPGGRVIRKLMEETGCSIEVDDDGSVSVSGTNDASLASAIEKIKGLTAEVVIGEIYEGEVKRIEPFGAFVEVLPGKDGLVHISRMGAGFVNNPEEIVKLGQKVKVKVTEVDDRGRINLTMLLNGEKKEENGGGSAPRHDFRSQRPIGNTNRGGQFSSHLMPKSRFSR